MIPEVSTELIQSIRSQAINDDLTPNLPYIEGLCLEIAEENPRLGVLMIAVGCAINVTAAAGGDPEMLDWYTRTFMIIMYQAIKQQMIVNDLEATIGD
jgi:hypothetical protein